MARLSLKAAASTVLLAAAVTVAGIVAVDASAGRDARPARTSAASRLVAIRAAHHARFDRVVFELSGGLPSRLNVRYVRRLTADPSGRPVRIAGRAVLEASLWPAAAHTGTGASTAPDRIAFALPNVITAVRAGDFESVLSYGIGLARRAPFHVFTLAHPSRVVVEVGTPFRTVWKRVYFENLPRFAAGAAPYVTGVLRRVPASTPAAGAMDRLFAGPTEAERATGLRLQRSGASGFAHLSIAGGVARVRLTGGCSSGGSTFTVADEIHPTLAQFPGVSFVKVYDPAGRTERPGGAGDSIPFCLEP